MAVTITGDARSPSLRDAATTQVSSLLTSLRAQCAELCARGVDARCDRGWNRAGVFAPGAILRLRAARLELRPDPRGNRRRYTLLVESTKALLFRRKVADMR